MRPPSFGKNKFFEKNNQHLTSFLTERMRSESKPIYIIERIVFRVIDTVL